MSRRNTGKAKNQSRKLRSKWTNTKKGMKRSETGAKIHHFSVERAVEVFLGARTGEKGERRAYGLRYLEV